jgi:hypothetical protein
MSVHAKEINFNFKINKYCCVCVCVCVCARAKKKTNYYYYYYYDFQTIGFFTENLDPPPKKNYNLKLFKKKRKQTIEACIFHHVVM